MKEEGGQAKRRMGVREQRWDVIVCRYIRLDGLVWLVGGHWAMTEWQTGEPGRLVSLQGWPARCEIPRMNIL